MRRRLLIIVPVAILLCVTVVFGWWALRPQPRIDQATLDKIQLGMTEREVIDIIGVPPGNYGIGEAHDVSWGGKKRWIDDLTRTKSWFGQEKGIVVFFDTDGKVVHMRLADVWREYDSHFDKLLQMMHLKQRKTPFPVFIDID